MNRLPFVFIVIAFLGYPADYLQAQIGGQNTYQFLNLPKSPRLAALGGKNVTLYNFDPTNAMENPALVNFEMDKQLAVNYMSLGAGINYGTASYAVLVDRRFQVLQGGISYVNYGSFDGFDEFGNATGDFGGNEVALSVGYAYRIGRSDFHVGGNAKLITSRLEEFTSFGGAVDLSVTYLNEQQDLRIAAVVRNLGTQFKPFNNVRESLPFEAIVGISQELRDVPIRWHVTLENLQEWNIAFRNPNRDEVGLDGSVEEDDPGFFNNVLRHGILGLELFPDGGFSIQVSYNFRRGEELRIIDQRSFAGLSAGFMLKINKLRFSYAYSRFNSAVSTNFFGLQIDLFDQ